MTTKRRHIDDVPRDLLLPSVVEAAMLSSKLDDLPQISAVATQTPGPEPPADGNPLRNCLRRNSFVQYGL